MNLKNRLLQLSIAVVVATMLFSCGKDDKQNDPWAKKYPSVLPSSQKIPIVAWHGVRETHATVERFQEAADMGITLNYTRFTTTENVCKALDAANQVGIKLIVECWGIYDEKDRTATVKKLMTYPALAGYFIWDEPIVDKFSQMAKMANDIRAIDKEHFIYTNLFPSEIKPADLGVKTYREYVQRFKKEVPYNFLSFDQYPIVGQNPRTLKPSWYQSLEVVSSEAKTANVEMWAFALTVRHASYPAPTLADLRLQIYSDLAYGAQAIQYFTYWTPTVANSEEWGYSLAPIAENGDRTPTYSLVKSVTAEIQKLSGVFRGANLISVHHTGSTIPHGTTKLTDLPKPVKVLHAESGAVVSQLENNGNTFLVIVNRNPESQMQLEFEAEGYVKRVMKDASVVPASNDKVLMVEPGDVVIYMW